MLQGGQNHHKIKQTYEPINTSINERVSLICADKRKELWSVVDVGISTECLKLLINFGLDSGLYVKRI